MRNTYPDLLRWIVREARKMAGYMIDGSKFFSAGPDKESRMAMDVNPLSKTAKELELEIVERYNAFEKLPVEMKKEYGAQFQARQRALNEAMEAAFVREAAAAMKKQEAERMLVAQHRHGTPEFPVQMGLPLGIGVRIPPPNPSMKLLDELAARCWQEWIDTYPQTAGEHIWSRQKPSRVRTYRRIAKIGYGAGYEDGVRAALTAAAQQ